MSLQVVSSAFAGHDDPLARHFRPKALDGRWDLADLDEIVSVQIPDSAQKLRQFAGFAAHSRFIWETISNITGGGGRWVFEGADVLDSDGDVVAVLEGELGGRNDAGAGHQEDAAREVVVAEEV